MSHSGDDSVAIGISLPLPISIPLSPLLPVANKPDSFLLTYVDVKHHVDSLGAELFPNGCFLDTVFVTLFRTAVERIQVVSHWRGPHLLNIVLLAVADGLFGLYGSERWDELLTGTRLPTPLTPPPFPSPVPDKPYGLCGRKAP